MGSPSSRLDTPEQYRAWVDAGLEYVYQPGGAQPQPAEAAPVSPAQDFVPQQQAAPQPQLQGQQNQPIQQSTPQSPQQPPQLAPQQPQTVQPQQAPTADVGNVKFPDPWSGFLARVKAKQPKVVCTYMELGMDLGGLPDPRRSSVLKNTLTHHLKWPPGTAAFWPMSALVNGALQPNSNMFWRGWEIWKSPYIACFGDEALKVILPDAQPGNTTYLLDHVTIYVVPPLAQLVNMLPHEQQIATELLLSVRF